MPTITAVVVPAKALKGGRHKIRIAIAHNSQTRYIVTDLVIDSAKEFRNGCVVRRPDAAMMNTMLRGLLQKYQESIFNTPYVESLSCSELIEYIKNDKSRIRHTLQSVSDEYLENAKIKESTRGTYRTYWARVSKYLKPSMSLDSITHATMLSLVKKLKDAGHTQGTINVSVGFVGTLLSYAKKCNYVQYGINPLVGLKLAPSEVRESWLTVEEVRRIRDLRLEEWPKAAKARDLFLLSYYLGGINLIDLYKYNFDEHPDTIRYVRTKTENRQKANKYVEFATPEEAKTIISRLKGSDGFIKSKGNRRRHLISLLHLWLPKVAELAETPQLIYYSARKSFSQHAFDLGAPESVIDYILGHKIGKGGTSLYSYIGVTPEMATKVIRMVLDNLK